MKVIEKVKWVKYDFLLEYLIILCWVWCVYVVVF